MSDKPEKFSTRERDMICRVGTRLAAVRDLVNSLTSPERQAFYVAELQPISGRWLVMATDIGLIEPAGVMMRPDVGQFPRMAGVSPLIAAGAAATAAAVIAAHHYGSYETQATTALRSIVKRIKQEECLTPDGYACINRFEELDGMGSTILTVGKRSLLFVGKVALIVGAVELVRRGAGWAWRRYRENEP